MFVLIDVLIDIAVLGSALADVEAAEKKSSGKSASSSSSKVLKDRVAKSTSGSSYDMTTSDELAKMAKDSSKVDAEDAAADGGLMTAPRMKPRLEAMESGGVVSIKEKEMATLIGLMGTSSSGKPKVWPYPIKQIQGFQDVSLSFSLTLVIGWSMVIKSIPIHLEMPLSKHFMTK